jgi:hypothetical protein
MGNEKRLDLIDRNALLEKGYWHGERPDWGNPYAEGVDAVDTVDIENAPSVDAVEVVHGYWKEWWCEDYITYFHKCSVCGWDALTKEETYHDEVLSNYCPNCGAKMDGGNENGVDD